MIDPDKSNIDNDQIIVMRIPILNTVITILEYYFLEESWLSRQRLHLMSQRLIHCLNFLSTRKLGAVTGRSLLKLIM